MDIRVDGTDELVSKLRDIVDEDLHREVGKALDTAGDILVDEAKRRVPVRTGVLRDSIKKRVSKKYLHAKVECDYPKTGRVRKKASAKQVAGAPEYYAFAVEYGTRKDPEQPFLHPAREAKENEIVDMIGEAVGKAVES